jgi:hypothetical protein
MNPINISFLHAGPTPANCANVNFSPAKAEKRIRKANDLLGKNVVRWIIGFALFLLGAKRKDVSNFLGIPYETLNSSIRRIWKDGAKAFEDRRTSSATPQTPPTPPTLPTPPPPTERAVCAPTPTAIIQEDEIVVHFPYESSIHIRIPYTNKGVAKAFLLTLLENQILDSQNVADILGYARNYTLYLKREMIAGSTEVLLDGRQGQKQDYVFKPEIKAELILQWSANAIAGKSTASEVLAIDLMERCGLDLSQRSIRYHIQKLGLKNIDVTLPEIIERLKKNSGK